MKKNPLALTVYRTVKAANDDATALSASSHSTPMHSALPGRSGWDPFEVWRTRIHVVLDRDPHRKR
jgi:hypothetical protein